MFQSPHERDVLDALVTPNSDQDPALSDTQIRAIHRAIYDAFERRPDGANIIQGLRAFRKGRPHVRIVMVPSPKNGGAFIPCEGRLEAAGANSFDIDPDVHRYRGQAFGLDQGTGHLCVPDFVIEHHDGTFTVVDIKPVGRLLDPKVVARMRFVRGALKQAGLRHRLITEVELQKQPARQIRDALRKGARIEISPFDRHRLLQILGEHGLTTKALRTRVTTLGLDPYCVEKLALLGDLSFPVNTQWSELAHLEAFHGSDHVAAAGRGTVRDVRIAL